jgi:hypothetical protein
LKLEELSLEQAQEIAKHFYQDILDTGRGFTEEERQISNGLMAFISAGISHQMAAHWKEREKEHYFDELIRHDSQLDRLKNHIKALESYLAHLTFAPNTREGLLNKNGYLLR